MDLPGVVYLAVDVVFPNEARALSVERVLTNAAPQTLYVPRTPVHVQQVTFRDDVTTPETHVALRLKSKVDISSFLMSKRHFPLM